MPIRERTTYLHTIKPWAAKGGKQIHMPDTDRFLSLKQDVLTISDLYSDVIFSVEALVSYLCACVCMSFHLRPREKSLRTGGSTRHTKSASKEGCQNFLRTQGKVC